MALWSLPSSAPVYCIEGSVLTAGAAVEWLTGLGILPEAAALDRVARSVPASDGVSFVPSLQGLGAPFGDGDARGLLGGLTRGTTRAHLARAAVEGIAHRCADLYEALVPGDRPLRVDGGLARSDLLLQTLADLIGEPVLRAAETETTALGAAWLAGVGAGVFSGPDECRSLAAAPSRFDPVREVGSRELARARWRRIVERARSGQAPAAMR